MHQLSLHSNMFLLILFRVKNYLYFHISLHSNMFLLIRKIPSGKDMYIVPLHSNMFLLILMTARCLNVITKLYIPICFY